MADVGTHYTGIRAYANERYIPKMVSRQYTRSPLLGMLVKRGGGDGELRPNSLNIVGGGNVMTSARRAAIAGSYQVNVFLQYTTVGGQKWMSARDTEPALSTPASAGGSQDQTRKSAYFRAAELHGEIIVWKNTTLLGQGRYAIGSAVDEALNVGAQDHLDEFIKQLYVGDPADQTADIWSLPSGLNQICDTDNTYGGLDRTVSPANTTWQGRRVTTNTTAALAIIDNANITQAMQDVGTGIDTFLVNKAAYLTIKAEALSKGGILIHRGTPEAARLGLAREAVFYGDVLITYDPWLKNYTDESVDLSAAAVGLTMGDLVLETFDGHFFTAGEFVDVGKYARSGLHAKRAIMETHFLFWTEKPWNHILYTAVSGSY